MKVSNVFRTLDRMKKYDYMKKSQYYKNMNRYRRQYKNAKTRSEKMDIVAEMENFMKTHPSYNNVNKFRNTVKKTIETINKKYFDGKKTLTEKYYIKYYEYMDKVSSLFSDYFYETEKVLNVFNNVVIIGGKPVEEALQVFYSADEKGV